MGNTGARAIDVVTARALRVGLDPSRSTDDATAALLPACHGNRRAAVGALDRLERAYLSRPDDVLARAVGALRGAVDALPDPPSTPRAPLHLVAPPS